jgi:SCY1-like protein 1
VLGANLNMNVVASTTVSDPVRDGWENDEWGSLEEEPANEELEEKENHGNNHVNASRSNSNSHSSGVYNNNITNSLSPTRNNGDAETLLNSSSNSNSNWENNGTGWNEDEFEPIEDTTAGESTGNPQEILD